MKTSKFAFEINWPLSSAKVQTHKSGIEVVRRRCLNSIPFTICLPCMSGLSVFLSSGGSYFTWQAKSYIPSTIKKLKWNLQFFSFGQIGLSEQYWKFCNFDKVFLMLLFVSYFHWQNIYKFSFPTCCSVRTEESINIKLRKLSISTLKCTFWGQIG